MVETARLEQALGYQFGDSNLLGLALTHCSVGSHNNERLEFLGDSILNHIIAEAIYHQFPTSREGEMSRMRAALVNGDTLGAVAAELGLGEYLRLGAGERKSGGHRRSSILADALEAVVGAILLDSDVEHCRRCVLDWFGGRLRELSPGNLGKDAKTQLQEYLQGRNYPLPEYALLSVKGDDHAQEFLVTCRLQRPSLVVEGAGSSRRKAEQDAAHTALDSITRHGN
jgi:ribonuclease-3